MQMFKQMMVAQLSVGSRLAITASTLQCHPDVTQHVEMDELYRPRPVMMVPRLMVKVVEKTVLVVCLVIHVLLGQILQLVLVRLPVVMVR